MGRVVTLKLFRSFREPSLAARLSLFTLVSYSDAFNVGGSEGEGVSSVRATLYPNHHQSESPLLFSLTHHWTLSLVYPCATPDDPFFESCLERGRTGSTCFSSRNSLVEIVYRTRISCPILLLGCILRLNTLCNYASMVAHDLSVNLDIRYFAHRIPIEDDAVIDGSRSLLDCPEMYCNGFHFILTYRTARVTIITFLENRENVEYRDLRH